MSGQRLMRYNCTTMVWRIVLLVTLLSAFVVAGPRVNPTKVRVTRHAPANCGGAALPPNAQPTKDTPVAGETFHFRRGTKNTQTRIIASAVTNGEGWLAVSLPAGTYCMIGEGKRKLRRSSIGPNAACLDGLARMCDAVIKAPTDSGTLEQHTPCFGPCYTGPMPP
ncbi:MAG: hypothetical protein ACKV2T_08465 [Kofleriaceae bacterium]